MYTQTKYPGLIIDINTKLLKDKRLRVIGRGINPETETEYTELPPYTTRPVASPFGGCNRRWAVAEIRTEVFYVL